MLELVDVRVRYGDVEAVSGVSLTVQDGEVVGLIGPNGAGKTSLLRAIAGLKRPAAGSITFDGLSLVGRAPEDIARLGVALVPEGRHVFRTLSVRENLLLGTTTARGDAAAKIEQVLDRFPILRDRITLAADRLSGGEQQQLAIARALIGGTKLLVLDEPSFGLAPKAIDTVYELLGELRAEGVTLLLVEQNARRTMEFCDRCLVLVRGSVRLAGTAQDLRNNTRVLDAYLGGI